ncbi:hypothetical protein AB9Q10_46275 [Streptomyces krungchingensis]|uniref:hypothetical protein n=1 Tax=Streptomyces krungchingensis TaxID=1565034 RepID=UPI003CEFDE41
MIVKGSLQDRLHKASDRLWGTFMVILMVAIGALLLMSFLGFLLVSLFFVLGGTVNH